MNVRGGLAEGFRERHGPSREDGLAATCQLARPRLLETLTTFLGMLDENEDGLKQSGLRSGLPAVYRRLFGDSDLHRGLNRIPPQKVLDNSEQSGQRKMLYIPPTITSCVSQPQGPGLTRTRSRPLPS